MSNNVWFTSDNHHFHVNIIKYCGRPWTFEEQTEELISRWNSRVGLMDDVYHLGDFAFAGFKQREEVVNIIKELNGKIHFIRGNHCDSRLWQDIVDRNLAHVIWVKDYAEIRVGNQKVVLCHYPLSVWNGSHHGSFMIHGHCHGSFQGQGKIMDVGIDAHKDFQVFSWQEISEFMKDREIAVLDHHEKGER